MDELVKITELDLSFAGTDLAPLAGLTGLQTLWLNRFAGTDLAPLAGLTGLQTLGLNRFAGTDLAPLAGLTKTKIIR
jgi:Leucine-rich repeat (LRR) protein